LSVITQSAPVAASKGFEVIVNFILSFFANFKILLFGEYFFGQPILSLKLNFPAASI